MENCKKDLLVMNLYLTLLSSLGPRIIQNASGLSILHGFRI